MTAPVESPPRAAVPGTQPEGIRDERAAAAYVREMFSRIAPRYDLLNHLLSLNMDKRWRRRTARRFGHILRRADARVLDLCCGTGDLALALVDEGVRAERKSKALTQRSILRPPRSFGADSGQAEGHREHRGATVWGSDFAHPMLVRAKEKAGAESHRYEGVAQVRFVEADTLQLPVADTSFDLVTAAFGFRNLANYGAGLREIHRVLKPGGEVGILEFAAPRSRALGALYRLYFTQILPRVGGAVSGNRAAYSYLPASVSKFPEPAELQAQMRAIGFSDPHSDLWTFGVVALHTARKPRY